MYCVDVVKDFLELSRDFFSCLFVDGKVNNALNLTKCFTFSGNFDVLCARKHE